MTTPIPYANYEAASAMLAAEHASAVLRHARPGSSAIVILVPDYGPILPHIGSSSSIADFRPVKRALPKVSPGLQATARSTIEQMQELLAALSLNKSQLAQILCVSRPTMYDWFQGKEPNTANTARLLALLSILQRADVSSATPLNARFVRQPMEPDIPSLVHLLSEERIDEPRVVQAIEQARALEDFASERRADREERLRALGFEEPGEDRRREQLAKNVALMDWPKR